MSTVLVPVTVDTLVVRPGDIAEAYAETRYAVPELPARMPDATRQPRIRQPILPAPFAERAQPRPPGVHLHWALPDALTRVDAATGRLPAVPCRWLVVRLGHRTVGAVRTPVTTAWLQPNVHDPGTTWVRDGHTAHQPAGIGDPALTIRGLGDRQTFQGWGFYADNVDGRLAFTDRLDHPGDAGLTGPLTYLVAGWYTHRTLDPLLPQAGRTGWEILDDLGWSVDRTLPIEPPDRTLVHGLAVTIAWPGAAAPPALPAERELRPAAGAVGVALSDTLTSATATVAFPAAEGTTAALAEAALAGELTELDEPDGLSRLDGTRHQLRFRAQGTGRGERDTIFESGGAPVVPPTTRPAVRADDVRPLSGSFAALRASFAPPVPRARAADPGNDDGTFTAVRHPTPRRWETVDPVAAVTGLGWSPRHGQDGRFDPEFATLVCRRTGETLLALHQPDRPVTWAGLVLLGAADPAPAGTWTGVVPATGRRIAAPLRLPNAVDLPAEVEPLVHELATVEPAGVPGYGTLLAGGVDDAASAGVAARLDWWTTWDDPLIWRGLPGDRFTALGTPPCPLAVTRPSRAWVPLHIDWRVAWTPLARGIAGFPLGELDFEPPVPWPAGERPADLAGRGILHDGPMRLLALAVQGPHPDGLPPVPELDVAGCSIDGFLERVRGTPEGLWFSPDGVDESPSIDVFDAEDYSAAPVAAGAWEVRDLRVVDAFGRTLRLIENGSATATLTLAGPLRADGAPGGVQRPRFTAPAMVDTRFLDPVAEVPTPVTSGQSPLVGWLAPTPLHGSAELFDATGRSLGRLAIDDRTRRTRWEDTPGDGTVPAGVVDPLDRIAGPVLARVARSLVDADRTRAPATRSDAALGTLLRLIATTLRFVDRTGGLGTGHLGLLLGTPIAVVRVGVTVDVRDPQASRAGSLDAQLTPVRLGSITRLADGVVAFVVEDQPDRLYPVHPILADQPSGLPGEEPAPITDPYLCREPVIWVRPGTMRILTVFVAPGAQLTATTGLAPRKVLDLMPQWTDRSAAELIPTLAFDAVLRSADAITLPTADDLNGIWTWFRRPAGETAWAAEELAADRADTTLGDAPSRVEDGYLRVRLLPPPDIKGVRFRMTCARRGWMQAIEAVGLRTGPGMPVIVPVDEAIRLVEGGRVTFFVDGGDHLVDVRVVKDADGHQELRALPADGGPDLLPGLPECPTETVVPHVVELTAGAARVAVVAAGLTADAVRHAFDRRPRDQVIDQNPPAGTPAWRGSPVRVTISDGPAATVPDVVGRPSAVATGDITAAALTVGIITHRLDALVPVDRVIDQQPPGDTQVAQSSAVTLTVSDGPAATVPEVIGQEVNAAAATLAAAGLTLSALQRRVDPAPEDIVVGQQPAAGSQVRPGSGVVLIVSAGAGVPVPSVLGLTENQAGQALRDAQLRVGVVFRLTVPGFADEVTAQTPAAGSRLPRGAPVDLRVNKGQRGPIPV